MDVSLTAHDEGCTPLSPCRNCRIAEFLRTNLTPESFAKLCEMLATSSIQKDVDSLESIFSQLISDLGLTVRTMNCLRAEDIYHIGELVQLTTIELMRIPNLGTKSANEIIAALNVRGLTLGMKLPDWKSPVSA